jgi:hypothetical protein
MLTLFVYGTLMLLRIRSLWLDSSAKRFKAGKCSLLPCYISLPSPDGPDILFLKANDTCYTFFSPTSEIYDQGKHVLLFKKCVHSCLSCM